MKKEIESIKQLLEADNFPSVNLGLQMARNFLGWDNHKCMDWLSKDATAKVCGLPKRTFEDFLNS